MSVVMPFRGLRPKPDNARQVASPPYDVLNTREARAMAKGNPVSFLRVNKSELEFDDNVDPYGEQVYQRARDNLHKFMAQGVLVREQRPCFYLYRLTMDGRSQTGLVARFSIEEYEQGKIKKHEHTRPEKVKDRANHIELLGAQVGPVFLAFKRDERILALFGQVSTTRPLIDFTADDGIRHELWVIEDGAMVQAVQEAFARVPHLYIADGHHRSESAAEVARRRRRQSSAPTGKEPYDYSLAVCFSDHELRILPYNRVIKDLNNLSVAEFLKRVSARFECQPMGGEAIPAQVHQFGMYLESKWYLLQAKPGTFDEADPTGSIDASILGSNLIGPILGIANPKTDKRIDFVGGIRGSKELVKLVDSGEFKLAFSMHATTIEQLLRVADAGDVMPPKSTWFEPKLRDGLVVNLLDE